MIIKLGQILSQIVFQTRKNCDKIIKDLSKDINNKIILEIGSGKKVNGRYAYSYKDYFNSSNYFVRSDVNPKLGHKIVDITKMNIKSKCDVIICLNVLEHVYEFEIAVRNLYKALKKNGILIYFSPYIYPLHDLPNDYFRFSEFALKKIFSGFSKCKIKHFGLKRFPSGYYVKAIK